MTNNLRPIFKRISEHFEKTIGKTAVKDLVAAITDKKVIAMSGEMYTGKDTQIGRLLETVSGEMVSSGNFFRSEAKELGIQPGILGAWLEKRPAVAAAFEPRIDYAACMAIAKGSLSKDYVVVQGRLAVWMAEYMRSLGKANICTIIFACEPREQALRMVNREVQSTTRDAVAPFLKPSYKHISEAIPDLERSGLVPRSVLDKLRIEAQRDTDNIERLLGVYGTDLRRTDIATHVIDTTKISPDQVYEKMTSCLRGFLKP